MGSTNSFGQSSSSSYDSQSVNGLINASDSNPLSPTPSGSTSSFGLQISSSLFGGTSTGLVGASQAPSLFSSTTPFGASSSPAVDSSVSASSMLLVQFSSLFIGTSSTSVFGDSSSSSAGSSILGQKLVSGGSASTNQTSPFGSAGQPSQPAFGSSIFGPLSTSAFAASSTPAFGASSAPSFSFGPTLTVGQSTSAFLTCPFGSVSSPLGGQGSPFGSQSTSSTFGSTGVWNSCFGSRVVNYAPTPNDTSEQTAKLGSISAMPIYIDKSHVEPRWETYQIGHKAFGSAGIGQSGFGGQRGGSRVVNYAPTAEADGGASGQIGKLESMSAMPVYKDKSHEELRWEDYLTGDRGGLLSSAQSTGLVGFK